MKDYSAISANKGTTLHDVKPFPLLRVIEITIL